MWLSNNIRQGFFTGIETIVSLAPEKFLGFMKFTVNSLSPDYLKGSIVKFELNFEKAL